MLSHQLGDSTNEYMRPWVLSHQMGRWERLHYYIDVAVGALSPIDSTNKLRRPWVLSHNDEAVGALSPDGLVGETPLIN